MHKYRTAEHIPALTVTRYDIRLVDSLHSNRSLRTIRMKALSPRPRKTKLKKPAQKTEEKLTCFAENRKFTLFPSGLVNVSFWRHTSTLVYVRQLFAYSKGLEYRRDLSRLLWPWSRDQNSIDPLNLRCSISF